MFFEKNDSVPETIVNRLELFVKIIQAAGVNSEEVPGLKKQTRHNYRKRENIPASQFLLYWSTNFDLNLHWLLLGEGPMFRKEIRDAVQRSEGAEERVQELKYTLALQKEKIEQLEKQQGGFLKNVAIGTDSVVPSLQQDTE